jgi:hypothetical protein
LRCRKFSGPPFFFFGLTFIFSRCHQSTRAPREKRI